jgi:hypothetical protein
VAGAPANTPPDIVAALNGAIGTGLSDAKVQASLADLGAAPMPMTAAEFGKFLADETAKWGQGGQVRQHQTRLAALQKIKSLPWDRENPGTCYKICQIH